MNADHFARINLRSNDSAVSRWMGSGPGGPRLVNPLPIRNEPFRIPRPLTVLSLASSLADIQTAGIRCFSSKAAYENSLTIGKSPAAG